jgi:hypothetical protein
MARVNRGAEGRMTRCHICGKPCVVEVEPAFGDHLPAVTEPDIWPVAMRNGIYVDACVDCWGMWPDGHKIFPPVGFGRWPDDERPKSTTVSLDDFVDVLRGSV